MRYVVFWTLLLTGLGIGIGLIAIGLQPEPQRPARSAISERRQLQKDPEAERIISIAVVLTVLAGIGGFLAYLGATGAARMMDRSREPMSRTKVAWIVAGLLGAFGIGLCLLALASPGMHHIYTDQFIRVGCVSLGLGAVVFVAGLYVKK